MKPEIRSGCEGPALGTHFVVVHQSLHFTMLCSTPLAPSLPMLSQIPIPARRLLPPSQILQRNFRVDMKFRCKLRAAESSRANIDFKWSGVDRLLPAKCLAFAKPPINVAQPSRSLPSYVNFTCYCQKFQSVPQGFEGSTQTASSQSMLKSLGERSWISQFPRITHN